MQYRKDNKEKTALYNREHYQKNQEEVIMKRHQKINCPCGRIIYYHSKSTHLKSIIHKQYLERDPIITIATIESKPAELQKPSILTDAI
jgi:hypothetical protein